MSLLAELNRRNVIKVGLFYAVASWLLIQVAETVLPLFDVPESMLRGMVIVLALGLLPTIVFAWIYELTPDGIKKESEIDRGQSVTGNTGDKLNISIVALLVITIGLVGFQTFSGSDDATQTVGRTKTATDVSEVSPAKPIAATPSGQSAGPPEKSIAVLPFVNMSSDVENEYFSDGLSEELLNLLVQIDALTVTSRTSSFAFKGQNLDIPTIAARLGVRHILEGSVRKSGNDIRVTAQLIQVEGDKHLWSDTFDRKLENIFALQDEIANEIAAALQIELGLLDRSSDYPTENLEAYDEYLRGNHLFMTRGIPELTASIEAFERATNLDPLFADAWAARARSAATLIGWDVENAAKWDELARESATQALALDPNSGVAYSAIGVAEAQMGEFEAGESHVRRAVELSPREATPRFWLGLGYQITGHLEKAREEMSIAERLDPLYGTLQYWSAINSAMRDDLEQMERHTRRVLAGSSDEANDNFAFLYLMIGKPDLAQPLLQEIAENPGEGRLDLPIVNALLGTGSGEQAVELAAANLDFISLMALDAEQRAVAELGRLVREGSSVKNRLSLGLQLWAPIARPLRQTAEFKDLVRGLKLDALWRKNGWPDLCRPLGEEDFECD